MQAKQAFKNYNIINKKKVKKMIIKIESNKILVISKIITNNYFYNVKNKKNLENFIFRYISNYYITSLAHNFNCIIEIDAEDNFNYDNIFHLIKDDYNSLFNENIEYKKEDLKIIIGGIKNK